MDVSLFDYNLPSRLIAQSPTQPRDSSRLFMFDRKDGTKNHEVFRNIVNFLTDKDVLVFNNSRVFPARLTVRKNTGVISEIFLLNEISHNPNIWKVMVRGRVSPNDDFEVLSPDGQTAFSAKSISDNNDGTWNICFDVFGDKFREDVDKVGKTPVPPYISEYKNSFKEQYQTVYAKERGSVAAPTAGLHFTNELMDGIIDSGAACEFITLHVGLGTFMPVKTNTVQEHKIHEEMVVIDCETSKRLNAYKKEGKRIIAVGTTVLRALESNVSTDGTLKCGSGYVDIFIYPPYEFGFVDSLITNFHLPKSSLLMLVSAFLCPGDSDAGLKILKNLYQEAIDKNYRFYSFGDAMYIV